MQKHLGSDGTFWIFSSAAFLNPLCVLWLVPETKGRTLEDITKFWTARKILPEWRSKRGNYMNRTLFSCLSCLLGAGLAVAQSAAAPPSTPDSSFRVLHVDAGKVIGSIRAVLAG